MKRLAAAIAVGAALTTLAEPAATATVSASGRLSVDTQGEVVSFLADTVSPRTGMALLTGSGSNAYRITWTAPRTVPDPQVAQLAELQVLTISLPAALDEVRGVEIGTGAGHCVLGGTTTQPEMVRGTAGDRITLSFPGLACAAGDEVDLTLVGRTNIAGGAGAPLPAGDHPVDAVLSERPPYPDESGFFPPDVVDHVQLHAVEPAHSLTIADAPAPNGDPYARLVTVTVRSPQGAVDTAFNGTVQLARVRCGTPVYAASLAVAGVARFLVVSPDLGHTYWVDDPAAPGGDLQVVSPRSVDEWVARLGDGGALLARTSFQLGPDDAPLIEAGDGYQCPTRSIF